MEKLLCHAMRPNFGMNSKNCGNIFAVHLEIFLSFSNFRFKEGLLFSLQGCKDSFVGIVVFVYRAKGAFVCDGPQNKSEEVAANQETA